MAQPCRGRAGIEESGRSRGFQLQRYLLKDLHDRRKAKVLGHPVSCQKLCQLHEPGRLSQAGTVCCRLQGVVPSVHGRAFIRTTWSQRPWELDTRDVTASSRNSTCSDV
jgi:hypothetical protein